MYAAAAELRDGVDAFLASCGGDDELEKKLGPLIDKVDEANIEVTEWLTSNGAPRSLQVES